MRLSPGWRRSSLRRAPPRGRRSGDEDCRWRPEKGWNYETWGKCYKTFYGRNYVAIGVTQSKASRNMLLVA
jgi:hypothetical protein